MRSVLIALAALAALAPPAGAIEIHAHRGGPVADGIAFTPEDAQPAFDYAHSIAADWVELDSTLSRDGVAVVMHDATLDRTTDCTGQVRQTTIADLDRCRVDTLGTESLLAPFPGSQVPIPRLADVLAWAKAAGARLNIEIKNIPTDPDFDPTTVVARGVLAAVTESGIPRDRVLIQSFWPPNLDEAEAQGFRTAFLTLAQMNEGALAYAETHGYDVLSPQWPPADPKAFVDRAHAGGRPVVPYTFNKAEEVQAAAAAGVDGVIVNDVPVAERVLRGMDCPTARLKVASATASLARIRALRGAARTVPSRRRYSAKEARSVAKLRAARVVRRRACNGA